MPGRQSLLYVAGISSLWNKLTSSPRWSLTAAAVLGLLFLVVGLPCSGLWEPHEIAVITDINKHSPAAIAARAARDSSREALKEQRTPDTTPSGKQVEDEPEDPPGKHAKRERCEDDDLFLPLSERLIAASDASFGGEGGARLPLALSGLAVVLLIWLLGSFFGSTRAALFSSAVAVTFPALVLGSRQLTGDTVSMLAATLTVTSAAYLLWPKSNDQPWPSALAALGVALGLVMGYNASGLLLGVVAPATALGAAGLAFSAGSASEWRRSSTLPRERVRVAGLTVVFGFIAIIALVAFVIAVFDLAEPGSDDRSLFGYTLAACKGATKAAMGSWRPDGDLNVNFNALFEQIAFGAFPWIVIAPIAIGRLAFARSLDRRALLGYVVFAWAAVTWLVAGIIERKISAVLYPALPAIAVGVGIWLDEHWPSKSTDDGAGSSALVALFAALGAAVLAKDLGAFPEQLSGIHVAGATYKLPEGTTINRAVTIFGMLFAMLIFVGIGIANDSSARGRWRKLVRAALPAALVTSLIGGLLLAHVWTPLLSRKLSSRNTFDVLEQVRKSGEPLGVLGRLGEGPKYYAGADHVELKNRNELYEFLKRPTRTFALLPVGDLCSLHAEQSKQGFEYHVLDDQNAKHLLISNKLDQGERDRNKLASIILRERPADIGKPMSVNFNDRLELIGVRMPETVSRGDTFEMTLFFEVKKRIQRNWNIFLHFDGAGQRFQGDHKPAELFCAATQWRPGDIIADTVKVEAGGMTYPKADYQVFLGLFTGSAGNWTNMEVVSKGADDANRYPIGVIKVR